MLPSFPFSAPLPVILHQIQAKTDDPDQAAALELKLLTQALESNELEVCIDPSPHFPAQIATSTLSSLSQRVSRLGSQWPAHPTTLRSALEAANLAFSLCRRSPASSLQSAGIECVQQAGVCLGSPTHTAPDQLIPICTIVLEIAKNGGRSDLAVINAAWRALIPKALSAHHIHGPLADGIVQFLCQETSAAMNDCLQLSGAAQIKALKVTRFFLGLLSNLSKKHSDALTQNAAVVWQCLLTVRTAIVPTPSSRGYEDPEFTKTGSVLTAIARTVVQEVSDETGDSVLRFLEPLGSESHQGFVAAAQAVSLIGVLDLPLGPLVGPNVLPWLFGAVSRGAFLGSHTLALAPPSKDDTGSLTQTVVKAIVGLLLDTRTSAVAHSQLIHAVALSGLSGVGGSDAWVGRLSRQAWALVLRHAPPSEQIRDVTAVVRAMLELAVTGSADPHLPGCTRASEKDQSVGVCMEGQDSLGLVVGDAWPWLAGGARDAAWEPLRLAWSLVSSGQGVLGAGDVVSACASLLNALPSDADPPSWLGPSLGPSCITVARSWLNSKTPARTSSAITALRCLRLMSSHGAANGRPLTFLTAKVLSEAAKTQATCECGGGPAALAVEALEALGSLRSHLEAKELGDVLEACAMLFERSPGCRIPVALLIGRMGDVLHVTAPTGQGHSAHSALFRTCLDSPDWQVAGEALGSLHQFMRTGGTSVNNLLPQRPGAREAVAAFVRGNPVKQSGWSYPVADPSAVAAIHVQKRQRVSDHLKRTGASAAITVPAAPVPTEDRTIQNVAATLRRACDSVRALVSSSGESVLDHPLIASVLSDMKAVIER